MSLSKIMLGSAQFGMDYGIANAAGKVPRNEVEAILNVAKQHHVHAIDTASVYGASEELLGEIADPIFKFVTKLPKLTENEARVETFIQHHYSTSLQKLKRNYCHGLLIHHASDLLGKHGDTIYSALKTLKSENKTHKIGVSVYSPDEAKQILEKYAFDILQFPLNILDQRFTENGLLEDLKKSKVELHARSIFLQGLLLMEEHRIPRYFDSIKPLLNKFSVDCQKRGRSIRQSLMDFTISNHEIDYYIVGIDNYQHLVELVNEEKNVQIIDKDRFAAYKITDSNIINPSKWTLT